MVKILLVCNAGMSTSLLVTSMQKAAKARELELEIQAMPITASEKEMVNWDVVMLGPQVRHCLPALQKKAEGKVPIEIINMRDYGMMNGEKVLDAALALLEKSKE